MTREGELSGALISCRPLYRAGERRIKRVRRGKKGLWGVVVLEGEVPGQKGHFSCMSKGDFLTWKRGREISQF